MGTASSISRTDGSSSPHARAALGTVGHLTVPEIPLRILIADDQPDVLEALRLLLKGEGFQIETARSPASILAAVESKDFDAVLMDLNYTRDTASGKEGLDPLPRPQALDWKLPVVVMTAWGSVESAVDGMHHG